MNLYFYVQQKSPFYVLIMGGWSLSLYLIQLVFKNLKLILKEHWHLAIGKSITHTHTHTYSHTYTHTHTFVFMYVCECVLYCNLR